MLHFVGTWMQTGVKVQKAAMAYEIFDQISVYVYLSVWMYLTVELSVKLSESATRRRYFYLFSLRKKVFPFVCLLFFIMSVWYRSRKPQCASVHPQVSQSCFSYWSTNIELIKKGKKPDVKSELYLADFHLSGFAFLVYIWAPSRNKFVWHLGLIDISMTTHPKALAEDHYFCVFGIERLVIQVRKQK